MFFKFGKKFADGELGKLTDLLELLDTKLSEINRLISVSADPDGEGLCDQGEYFIGVGFVAIQQYLTDTLLFTGVERFTAFALGPSHASNISCINLINSGANWWKHEAEWVNAGSVPNKGQRTFEDVTNVAQSNGYELSNILASICDPDRLSLSSLLPYLIEWRAALDQARTPSRPS